LELLLLLDPSGPPASCRPVGETPVVRSSLRDLPSGPELAELGCRLLLDGLMPLLPPERHREAHLVATAIAIAQREAAAGDAPVREILELLAELYAEAKKALSGSGGEEGVPAEILFRRFGRDLRNGAFETSLSQERLARAILWRLTIARLRAANPAFLAAHGLE
jgi:hypothetical protein